MIQTFIDFLHTLSTKIPVELFVIVGSFIEEIVAPIPSPFVMMVGGSITASQGKVVVYLLLLALLGAVAKTIGSVIIYYISDKAEDVIIGKFGKFIGVSHDDTEGLGSFFSKGKRDDITMFLLRAFPVMPTAPVSVIAGLIKIPLRTYIISTFLGLLVRNCIYLYVGYIGLGTIESLSSGFDSMEKIGYLVLFVFAGVALLWLYRKRQKGSLLSLIEKIMPFRKK